MRFLILALVFVLPLTVFAADQPSTKPSVIVNAAISKRASAMNAARDAYNAGIKTADNEYTADLTQAMQAAMKQGPSAIDEVKRIDQLQHDAKSDREPNEKLAVVNARWGIAGHFADVTELVHQHLRAKTPGSLIDTTGFPDPAPAKAKQLIMDCTVGNVSFTLWMGQNVIDPKGIDWVSCVQPQSAAAVDAAILSEIKAAMATHELAIGMTLDQCNNSIGSDPRNVDHSKGAVTSSDGEGTNYEWGKVYASANGRTFFPYHGRIENGKLVSFTKDQGQYQDNGTAGVINPR